MALRFTKMQGCGNDFIVVDAISETVTENVSALAVQVNDRRFGVGGDGLILVSKGDSAPFRMRMLNPDGSESEMCGNGVRCVAKFVRDRGMSDAEAIPIETGAGLLELSMLGDRVRAAMGKAGLRRGEIPMAGPSDEQARGFEIEVYGQRFVGTAVSMGNPHCVIFVDDVDAVPLPIWGASVERNSMFPERINAHFIQVISPTELRQRTWERGAGATLACGTGACASLVAAFTDGKSERKATVHLPGGDLEIEYAEDGSVFMTGPAETVFEGTWG
ncbi:MAG TPA: diaminopimelate epimerase [Fimbriimonadales bacterium]|nr:diaminopimelate epimerase [Fimbriimonadales bacterium]